MAVNGENSGQEINVVISNMSLYPMLLYPKFTVVKSSLICKQCSFEAGGGGVGPETEFDRNVGSCESLCDGPLRLCFISVA